MRRHAATQTLGLCAPSLSISFRGELSSFSGCADVASYGVVMNDCCAWNAAEIQVHVNIMSTPGHHPSLSFDLETLISGMVAYLPAAYRTLS